MSYKYWPPKVKNQALMLRKDGKSIGNISKSLGISKSTIHSWTGSIKRSKKDKEFDRRRWAKEIQAQGALGSHKRRQEALAKISKRVNSELKSFEANIETQKSLLSMLYWSEGSKGIRSGVVFANTDPYLNMLFITLLRNCYKISEEKFRGRIHIHDYHDEVRIKEYWSELLQIPISQFNKSHIKDRSKNRTFRKNLAGICYIKYNSVHLKEEILMFGREVTNKLIIEDRIISLTKRL